MNFFKSVFSTDPDPSNTSSDEESPSEKNESAAAMEAESEIEDHSNSKQNTPWIGLGTLIKTFASKSESVIQTYRRDLEEFGSGLKKETEAIREVATRAVRDLPSSLEAGASVAQESLESVGQAIDDFGGSVWRGTSEIIAGGKDALLVSESDVETHLNDVQNPGSALKRYSRFEAQVLAMQSDFSTFTEEPEDGEDFVKWVSEFRLDGKEEEIESLCYENGGMEEIFEKLVPSVVDYETFWTRYFYKFGKLKQAEELRVSLVKRAILREDEDLTWEVDDEEETEKEFGGERIDEIKEEDEVKLMEKERGQVECLEEEKVDTNAIEVALEKKPDLVSEDLSFKVTAAIDSEIVSSSTSGVVVDAEAANNGSNSRSGDKVLHDSKPELVESCKDSDVSIVSSQISMPEEEDLGWDEIEDLGEHDDKKVGGTSSTMNKVDLHKKPIVLEEDEDLTWDIEDDE